MYSRVALCRRVSQTKNMFVHIGQFETGAGLGKMIARQMLWFALQYRRHTADRIVEQGSQIVIATENYLAA